MSVDTSNHFTKWRTKVSPERQAGLTLVEMMIASSLSMVILTGMLQLMEGTSITAKLNDSLSNIQLTGHYSMGMLRGSLKYRGFEGCRRPVSLDPWQESDINWSEGADFTNILATDFPIDNVAQSSLRGYEVSASGAWTPTPNDDLIKLRDEIDPAPIPNSDVISVYYVTPESVSLAADMANTSEGLLIEDDNLSFEQGEYVYIGDCMRSTIFSVSNAPGSSYPITLEHDTSVNESEDFTDIFTMGVEIRKVYIDTYYVGNTNRKTASGDPIYSLYRFREGETTEMIEGIENLQVVYGEELPNGNFRYLNADHADLNMRVVNSLQIGLLVYHHSNVLPEDDTKTYHVLDSAITPPSEESESSITHLGGLYLRKVFTESVHMLNRS